MLFLNKHGENERASASDDIQSSLLQARYIIVQLLDGVANSPQNTSANTAAGLSIFQILVYLALTLG